MGARLKLTSFCNAQPSEFHQLVNAEPAILAHQLLIELRGFLGPESLLWINREYCQIKSFPTIYTDINASKLGVLGDMCRVGDLRREDPLFLSLAYLECHLGELPCSEQWLQCSSWGQRAQYHMAGMRRMLRRVLCSSDGMMISFYVMLISSRLRVV